MIETPDVERCLPPDLPLGLAQAPTFDHRV